MGVFKFKQFTVVNERSAMKVGTDGVLLGAAMTVPAGTARFLDIGTGTGTIALMAAQRCPEAIIDAIDIDEASASEAALNFEASPWPGRLRAFHTPLKEFSPETGYDLIFSNPPYFDDSLTNPDARKSEARHSLSLSREDILEFAAAHLNERGTLAMVLPADCERILKREAVARGLYLFRILRIRTTEKKPAARIIVEFCAERTDTIEEELVLQEKGKRTQEYISLTSAFYLNC